MFKIIELSRVLLIIGVFFGFFGISISIYNAAMLGIFPFRNMLGIGIFFVCLSVAVNLITFKDNKGEVKNV